MKPIYKPKGAAAEYGDYAINIYTGCPHRCYYCFAPQVLHIQREVFHSRVFPKNNIVEETRKQLERDETLRGKLIHLCFACDPYPAGYDTTTTREVIRVLKEYGNNVQILTKGDGYRDSGLLDSKDWYGVTISGAFPKDEPNAISEERKLAHLAKASARGIKTWISFEPVISASFVLNVLRSSRSFVDKVKIGKLNYHPSDIDWAKFGREAEELCQELGIDYYIKGSLRKEMERP